MEKEIVILVTGFFGLLLIIKPKLLFMFQDPIDQTYGLPPMGTRVRPIFVRLMGVVIIIIGGTMYLK